SGAPEFPARPAWKAKRASRSRSGRHAGRLLLPQPPRVQVEPSECERSAETVHGVLPRAVLSGASCAGAASDPTAAALARGSSRKAGREVGVPALAGRGAEKTG